MVYPVDGRNHKQGIKNEINLIQMLNNKIKHDISDPIIKTLTENHNSKIVSFEHIGGTKQKADILCKFENGESVSLSVKNHKTKTSTFDWLNTTQCGIPDELKTAILCYKQKYYKTELPKNIRVELDNLIHSYINKITNEVIISLFKNFIDSYKEENVRYLIINDCRHKQYVLMPISFVINICTNHNFILKSSNRKASKSRMIWIKNNNGTENNTRIRSRLGLNNGVKALLGMSKKNKSSVVCFKLQQEHVDDFINKCDDKVISKY